LKTVDRNKWNEVFNENKKEIDHTILECLAYVENSEIIIDYIEIKLPDIFVFFWNNLPYHNQSKSTEQAETLITNIFLSTLAKNARHMLEDILNNFKNIMHYYG